MRYVCMYVLCVKVSHVPYCTTPILPFNPSPFLFLSGFEPSFPRHVSRQSDGAFRSLLLSFQGKHPPPGDGGGLDVADQGNWDPESTRQVVPPSLPPQHDRTRRCMPHSQTAWRGSECGSPMPDFPNERHSVGP